jgi:hypothetical protein
MARSRIAAVEESNGDSPATPPEEPKVPPGSIVIPKFNFITAMIMVEGINPLICNSFPDKEKKRMFEERSTDSAVQDDPGGKKKKKARPARDFKQEYIDSLYPLEGVKGYGFPAIAFKRAIVGACRQVSNLDMTMANRIIFVAAPFTSKGFGCVRIKGEPSMRQDVVRLSGIDKPPDLRYRGAFFPWSALLEIEFNASMISLEGIYNLIRFAGKCEGVGEQRPSAPKKSGDFGQFRLMHRETKA